MTFEQQREDYLAALGWVAGLMASTPPAQLGLPTPCAEYDARSLMGHLIGTAERGLATAERRSSSHVPHVVTDVPDEELASSCAALARRIGSDAWMPIQRSRTSC
ncbi:MAG: maleylpyruvate isomerase N-terminal domain-containing protein [Oryzihumus sp.]